MLEQIDHRKLLGDDAATIARFLEELEALTLRIARYQYRFRQDEAEEVLLETVRKLWDADKAALRAWRGQGSLSQYLTAIVHRFCLMELRRRKRSAVEQPMESLDRFQAVDLTQSLEQDELTRLYHEAAAGLSDRDRRLLELRFLEEQDYPAITEELGISYAAARKAVHTALGRIRERMRKIAPELFRSDKAS